jgi:hypothetical protein
MALTIPYRMRGWAMVKAFDTQTMKKVKTVINFTDHSPVHMNGKANLIKSLRP